MIISDAFADPPAPAATSTTGVATSPAGAPPAGADAPLPLQPLLMFPFLFLVFYFLLIRPNQKRIKDYEAMVGSLKRGDRVVTGGGILGTISKIENDDVLVIEIAPEVKVRVMRDTISSVVNKTIANDNKADEKAKKAEEKANA